MALQPRIIACGTMATIGMAIRFIGGPLVMSAASIAVGLKGVRLHTAIVQVIIRSLKKYLSINIYKKKISFVILKANNYLLQYI